MTFSQEDRSVRVDSVEYVGLRDNTRSRRRLLAELDGLPDAAFVTARHAAAYIDTSYANLANWRSQRRGPPFVAAGRNFIRYRLGDLRSFMAERMKTTVSLNENGSDRRLKKAEDEAGQG